MAKRIKRDLDYEERRIRAWIKVNHGILTRIALMNGINCTPQFVQAVAYGRTTAREGRGCRLDVEKALKRAGWPGIRRYK